MTKEKVLFAHCENNDDIIISLSCEEGSTFGIDGFIITRTPKYEFILTPEERGACVEWEEDDIRVLVDEVRLHRNDLVVITRGKKQKYYFNLEELSDDGYRNLVKHFHLINFDNSIEINLSSYED